MTSLKSNSKALKQSSRPGPPTDWLHRALTPHSFKLVVFCSLSSLPPKEESVCPPVGRPTVGWEEHDAGPQAMQRGSSVISAVTCLQMPFPSSQRTEQRSGNGDSSSTWKWKVYLHKAILRCFLLRTSSLSCFSPGLASTLVGFILFVKAFPNI